MKKVSGILLALCYLLLFPWNLPGQFGQLESTLQVSARLFPDFGNDTEGEPWGNLGWEWGSRAEFMPLYLGVHSTFLNYPQGQDQWGSFLDFSLEAGVFFRLPGFILGSGLVFNQGFDINGTGEFLIGFGQTLWVDVPLWGDLAFHGRYRWTNWLAQAGNYLPAEHTFSLGLLYRFGPGDSPSPPSQDGGASKTAPSVTRTVATTEEQLYGITGIPGANRGLLLHRDPSTGHRNYLLFTNERSRNGGLLGVNARYAPEAKEGLGWIFEYSFQNGQLELVLYIIARFDLGGAVLASSPLENTEVMASRDVVITNNGSSSFVEFQGILYEVVESF